MSTTTTVHVRPGEGERHVMPDGDHVAKATVEHADGAFEVFELVAPEAPMAPPHVSPWSGVLYVVAGRVTVLVDGAPHDVEPGGLVVVPAGTPATFAPVGGPARLLVVTSGTGAGRFFADFAASVPAGQPVESVLGAVLAVTGRHGVRLPGV